MEATGRDGSAKRSAFSHSCPDFLHVLIDSNMHQTPLPADMIKHMMSFLTPRDLLNVSVTSKCFRSIIDEEVVVKVGLFSGGNSKQSMKNLISMLRDQSIFIPDAM